MRKFQIPILETSRLKLRAHSLADFPSCVEMWSDPVVTRYTIGVPSTEQRSWMRVLAYLGHWELMGFGYWAVEEKASGQFIGELGFADFKREIQIPMRDIPELGWALRPQFHGKGYATEALMAAIQWGDQHLPVKKSVCLINPKNGASLRVAEKCGYKETLRTEFMNEPTILFSRSF